VKIRVLSVLGVCLLGATTLTACDSKVGTAAVVGGNKISESQIQDYLTPQAQPIPVAQGITVQPRTFVIETAIASKIFDRLLAEHGGPPSQQQLDEATATVLTGTTQGQLTDQVVKAGLTAKFAQVYLHYEALSSLVGDAFNKDTTKAAAAANTIPVVVNPRYGAWNSANFSLTDLSKAQLPSFITYNGNFPGDPQPTQ
jgi:hypothetical protein